MRIQEIEYITGLDRASIRFYEREQLLSPKRTENGYRDYSNEDAQLLKKIKLLRRLGVSVSAIKELQQGREELSEVIQKQIENLTAHIDDQKRCRVVCQNIYEDGAVFSSLNADHYIKLLHQTVSNKTPDRSSSFREELPQQIHPWKRYFARAIDFSLLNSVIMFIIVFTMRVRPAPQGIMSTLVTVFSAATMIPIEALLLRLFGTTPGKWVLGIELEYIQGGHLPWKEAILRSGRVFLRGTGCYLPIVMFVTMVYRYSRLTGRSIRRFARYSDIQYPEDMPWDEQTEIIYNDFNRKRGAVLAIILSVIISLTTITALDSIKPQYRGSELTIAQFAQNYNTYLHIVQEEVQVYEQLRPDGSKYPVPENVYIIPAGWEQKDETRFEYILQNDIIQSVVLQEQWQDVSILMPISGEPKDIAFSLLLAQNGCGYRELGELEDLFNTNMNSKEVCFTYQNLKIEWKIETDLDFRQGMIYSGDENNQPVSMWYCITIN